MLQILETFRELRSDSESLTPRRQISVVHVGLKGPGFRWAGTRFGRPPRVHPPKDPALGSATYPLPGTPV